MEEMSSSSLQDSKFSRKLHYVSPELKVIDLKIEERLLGCTCTNPNAQNPECVGQWAANLGGS
jgi:hypothetical protein